MTHGLIVGMTGSGKTGLAIVLIEEALRRGIPVLAVDPKGDLANLLLLFDTLDPAQFAACVDADAARRDGLTREQAGTAAAAEWAKGLAAWGLSAPDVAELHRAHEATVFTPGSRAGVPLDLFQSLAAPPVPFAQAAEELRDEIAGIVSGLLGLVGIEADPLRSREAILLGTLIETAWRLAQTVWTDPVTGAVSGAGEDRDAFVARLAGGGGSPQAAKLRDRLDKKKLDLEARQRDLEGRRTEKWVALGAAVLGNVGLLTGRKRTLSGAGTVVSKNRMENTAEARVEALKAEIAALEEQLSAHTAVDPARLQSSTVVPTRTQVKLLRYGIVWVY